jgi:hypothetical protein
MPATNDRYTITADEVRKWFELGHKPWPEAHVYEEIAQRLTRARWGSDPSLPTLREDEAFIWQPDADAILTKTITVARGRITIDTADGVEVTNNGSASVTLRGTAGAIAAALRKSIYVGDAKNLRELKDATTGATGKWAIGPSPFEPWALWDAKEAAAAIRSLQKAIPAMLAHYERLSQTAHRTVIEDQIPLWEGAEKIERLCASQEDCCPQPLFHDSRRRSVSYTNAKTAGTTLRLLNNPC